MRAVCFLFLVLCVSGFASEEHLARLNAQVQKDLQIITSPFCPWLPIKQTSSGAHIYDVVIVGGGQTGLGLAFALKKEHVTNILIFDENEEGFEGPWLTYAHMDTLRSSKTTNGPNCDVPSLACQSWYEAKYGAEAWEALKYIPRVHWAEYLKWFREVLNLPVVNRAKVQALRWDAREQCFIVPIESGGEVYARKVILATGLQGSGQWSVPCFMTANLPKALYSSAYEDIPLEKLKGKKVAILGAGPCAFDMAILSHGAGAEEIHLFSKRSTLVDKDIVWRDYLGFLRHFPDLADEDKWKFIAKMHEIGQAPVAHTVAKVRAMNNVYMHFNSPWLNTTAKGDLACVETPEGEYAFDYLLVSTGCVVDLSLREELKEFYGEIALWCDCFCPPEEQHYEPLLCMPYLGEHFQFTERSPGKAPYVRSVFNATGGALMNAGFSIGSGLAGLKYGIQRIVDGVVGQLFLEERDYYYEAIERCNDSLYH